MIRVSLYFLVLRTFFCLYIFFFQAEDGIRDLVRSRGLGDVYKRQLFASRMGTRFCALAARVGAAL